ncbi:MAG: hypothetical protein HYU28_02280 [Actinobacteria bacterium]|nr:hypothetical protein [Actinomycetota bacterium]
MQFDLPAVPEGHKVTKFELRLTPVDDPRYNYHFDSPAFRQAVVAALVATRQDPAAFEQELKKVGDADHEPLNTKHLGVEACPIVADWAAGGNQDATTAPERDSVERRTVNGETKTLPQQVNCALNASVHVIDGVWVFDLTFAANAWATGRIENRGVLLRPVLPPNLAYGDPDLSTWDQVTFTNTPQFVFETAEKKKAAVAPAPRTVAPQVLSSTAESTETVTESFGGGESAAIEVESTPDEVATSPSPPIVQQVPAVLSGNPVTKWWTWLLLPMLLGGVFLTTQALTAEPVLAATERSGAMSRLIEARRRGLL